MYKRNAKWMLLFFTHSVLRKVLFSDCRYLGIFSTISIKMNRPTNGNQGKQLRLSPHFDVLSTFADPLTVSILSESLAATPAKRERIVDGFWSSIRKKSRNLDIAFVLDCTGSMEKYVTAVSVRERACGRFLQYFESTRRSSLLT